MPKYAIDLNQAKLHLSGGNRKVGKIMNFSTLPGNSEHLIYAKGELLTSIPGTCSHNCDNCFNSGCYAKKSVQVHHNCVTHAWGDNTLLLREHPDEMFEAINKAIAAKNAKFRETGDEKDLKVAYFRINVSGEIENLDQLIRWDRLARQNPEVKFGLYTKNLEVLGEFLDRFGDSAPNFTINVSEWHGYAAKFIEKYKGKVNVFEYDDSKRSNSIVSLVQKVRLAKLAHCPAVNADGSHGVDKDGKRIKCEGCGNCYRKTGRTTAVYAH